MKRVLSKFLCVCVTFVTLPAAAAELSPRIVNGTLSFDDPTAGALLSGPDPDHATSWCSGTLIGCNTFVTAAHCVCDLDGPACQSGSAAPDLGDYWVFLQHAGFFGVQSIAIHTGYDFPKDDVAVLTLASPVSGISPTPLIQSKPALGTGGTIVGFGRSGGGGADYGLKRRGSVTTAACPNDLDGDLVCWIYSAPVGAPGTDSNTCNGDSGGPLFVDVGGVRSLAGITSGGESFDCNPTDKSYDGDVAAQRSWIQSHASESVDGGTCGALSQVGDGVTQVVGFTQTLGAGKTDGTHSFVVGADVTRLRVALEASEEDLGGDVDLFVRFGAAPTLSLYDCRANGPNQFGFCEFDHPSAGTWNVLVKRFTGTSTYQLTATLFQGAGEPPPPPPPAQAQTREQRRCLNGLASAGSDVIHALFESSSSCVHAYARGRPEHLGRGAQPRTAQACLTNDVGGDVAVAEQRTLERDAERCLARPDQKPDFAYLGAGPVNSATVGQAGALIEDLFGADLDAVLVPADTQRGSARCQATVADASGRVVDAAAKLAVKAKRQALKGRKGTAPAGSLDELETQILSAFAGANGGSLGGARAALRHDVSIDCSATETARSALLPGVCAAASSASDLAACVDRAALCRFCRAQDAMDDLALDCDLFDDGVPNLTCAE